MRLADALKAALESITRYLPDQAALAEIVYTALFALGIGGVAWAGLRLTTPRWKRLLGGVPGAGGLRQVSLSVARRLTRRHTRELVAQAGFPWGWPAEQWTLVSAAFTLLGWFIGFWSGGNVSLAAGMAGLGYLLPEFALRVQRRAFRQKVLREISMFWELLEVYLTSGHSLLEALKSSAVGLDVLRNPVERCALRWGEGATVALEGLRREINMAEMDLVANALRQAVDYSPQSLAAYLAQESATLERVRQEYVNGVIAMRSQYIALYALLPASGLLLLFLGALAYRTTRFLY